MEKFTQTNQRLFEEYLSLEEQLQKLRKDYPVKTPEMQAMQKRQDYLGTFIGQESETVELTNHEKLHNLLNS